MFASIVAVVVAATVIVVLVVVAAFRTFGSIVLNTVVVAADATASISVSFTVACRA